MKTLIVVSGGLVRFFLTNHPVYRFQKLQEHFPCSIHCFGVTSAKAKDIKLQFANLHHHGEWYYITDELEQHLASLLED